MFVDRRLYNTPRNYLKRPKEYWMLVPQELQTSVVFIGVDTGTRERLGGTGFFISCPTSSDIPGGKHIYLATAAHCVEEQTGLFARLNTPQPYAPGKGVENVLLPDGDDEAWVYLRTYVGVEDYVDLALIHWNEWDSDTNVQSNLFTSTYKSVPKSMFFDESNLSDQPDTGVGVGDEVVAIGLLDVHYGSDRNAPVVRTGNLAMIPDEPVLVRYKNGVNRRMRLYLTELRSISGLSGSPVFVKHRASAGAELVRLSLLGLMIGHWDDRDNNHMGFGKVVPAKVIGELLDQEDLVKKRMEAEERHLQEEGGTAEADSRFPQETEFERFQNLTRKLANTPKPEKDESTSG